MFRSLLLSLLLLSPTCQPDSDGDGFPDDQDCDDGNPSIYPDAAEVCDHVDNDCDDVPDDGLDFDGDEYTPCYGDCEDSNPATNSGAYDVQDGADNDCDGLTDDPGWQVEGVVDAVAADSERVCAAGDAFVTCYGLDEWSVQLSDAVKGLALLGASVYAGGTESLTRIDAGSIVWSVSVARVAGVAASQDGIYAVGQDDAGAVLSWYSVDGVLIRSVHFSAGAHTRGTGVSVREDGRVFVTGNTNGTLGEEAFGEYDGWLAVLTSELDVVNVTQFGTEADDFPSAVTAGGVLVGTTYAPADGTAYSDAFAAGFDGEGNLTWSARSGTELDDGYSGVTVLNGTARAVGYEMDFAYQEQATVATYSWDGVLSDKTVFGALGNDSANAVAGPWVGGDTWGLFGETGATTGYLVKL